MTTQADRENDPATPPLALPRAVAATPVIGALTGIRAVVAAWVVLVHFQSLIFVYLPALTVLQPLLLTGYLAVDFFFLLSGFVIAYNYAERMRSRTAHRKFLRTRIARIYPLQATTTLVMVLLGFPSEPGRPLDRSPSNVAGNLFMLQSVPGFQALNGPSWSLCCEAGAYLVFPLIAWWAVRLSSRAALGWAATVMMCGVVAVNGYVMASHDPSWSLSYPVMWLRVATAFTTGVLMWAWWRGRPTGSARWDVVAVGCLLVGMGVIYVDNGSGSPRTFALLPLLALSLVACASATGPVARLLSSRPMCWGGDLTFSIYMSHYILAVLFIKYVPWLDYVHVWLPIRVAFLAVLALWIVGIGAGLHYFVETPGRKLMLRWTARPRPTRAGV